jgi:uncharacterized protein (TIGR00251 family)
MNAGGITIGVRVTPRSSRSEVVGFEDGVLKVRISASPVDNAANAELIKVLAKTLNVPKSSIEIISGQTSRVKRVRVGGLTPELLNARLAA